MKYALTFTIDPNTCDWESVDTVLFEYPDNLPEDKNLENLVAKVLNSYGYDLDLSKQIAGDSELWYVLNCNDVDIIIEKEGE